MNLYIFILVIGLCGMTSAKHNSRAVQNFGCNCLINKHIQKELELGFQYFNASNYMLHDSVAMKGFGKMFDSFWKLQFEAGHKIQKYVILRGGITEVKKLKLTQPELLGKPKKFDHFANIASIVHKFVEHEKDLNNNLLNLHECNFTEENNCRKDFGSIFRKNFPKDRQEEFLEDPVTAMYLDENFLGQKVERIKYLSDLLTNLHRLHRYHRYENGTIVNLGLNPIGVHMMDHGLEKEY